MNHIANDFDDILTYIQDLCGTEPPERSAEEIKDYLRERHELWDYGEDMASSESGLHQVIEEMFATGWIRGREAA